MKNDFIKEIDAGDFKNCERQGATTIKVIPVHRVKEAIDKVFPLPSFAQVRQTGKTLMTNLRLQDREKLSKELGI